MGINGCVKGERDCEAVCRAGGRECEAEGGAKAGLARILNIN